MEEIPKSSAGPGAGAGRRRSCRGARGKKHRTKSGNGVKCPPITAWAISRSPRRLGLMGSTGGQNGGNLENVRRPRSRSWLEEILPGREGEEASDKIRKWGEMSANHGVGFKAELPQDRLR